MKESRFRVFDHGIELNALGGKEEKSVDSLKFRGLNTLSFNNSVRV
jgi:hypothetical protein